jgi:ComF family protein
MFLDLPLDLLFPRRCPICDEPVRVGDGLACAACLPRLSYIGEPFCLKCGKKLADPTEFCTDCTERGHLFDRGFALYEYPSIAGSVYRFKYKNRQEYADFFGAEICRHLGREILELAPECLIPVPIHKKRLQSRGYNQASLLAQVISRHLDIPLEDGLIARTRATAPQKKLNLAERQNNLKKAFIITQNDVKLERVMIVDDIFTTGSTIDVMAEELKSVGIRKIYFVALSIGKMR